ncbi:NAD(P)-dependent oxidoreductase [Candidatus Daviesbacteria bacterium]|nr:NAD(P)-dependent oxidoreductase [Candidatus Daviesbacteria bacterium]
MRIFITGATGFIGQHLIKRLTQEGYEISVLARHPLASNMLAKGVKIITGDINRPQTFIKNLNSCQILIHLAAERSPWDPDGKIPSTNSQSLLKIITQNSQLEHLIITSSVYAMGDLQYLPADEKHPLAATDIYGISKIKLEETCRQLYQKYHIPFTIIRPCIVYGPGDNKTGMVMKMVNLIRKRQFFIIGNGCNLLHLIYIDDLVEAFLHVIKQAGVNQIYIIAGAKPIQIKSLAEIIARELGSDYSPLNIPKRIALLAAYIIEFIYLQGHRLWPKLFYREPPITVMKVKTIANNWNYDITKATKELNFSPKVNYAQGIKSLIAYLKTS